MTRVATIWVVYQLTTSPFMLGLVGFASQIPNFIFAPIGGIITDRWNRHRLLLMSQFLFMLQSLTLAILTLTGTIEIEYIVVLSVMQGTVRAIDVPARQSFVTEMVERKEDLGNAIALNSAIFNSARLIGPAIAGMTIAIVGAGLCFLIDSLSYIAVIAALFAMKIQPTAITVLSTNPWQRLKEGFVYAFGFPPIRAILLLLSLVSMMGMSYITLVPIFATEVLQGGSDTLGWLMAASGGGALISGIYLSSRQTVLGLGRIIAFSPALLGISLIGFSLSRILWISVLMMFAIGLSSVLNVAASNTLLQTIVEDEKRGRLMSFYSMSLIGMMPFGYLFVGSLADFIGAPYTLTICGLFCLMGSFLFAQQLPRLRELLHPIYLKLGILS